MAAAVVSWSSEMTTSSTSITSSSPHQISRYVFRTSVTLQWMVFAVMSSLRVDGGTWTGTTLAVVFWLRAVIIVLGFVVSYRSRSFGRFDSVLFAVWVLSFLFAIYRALQLGAF